MNCPRCFNAIPDDARFCADCGLSLEPGKFRSQNSLAQTPEAQQVASSVSETIISSNAMDGVVLDGKYEILVQLGEGGMGTVYVARRRHIGDEVAVKILHSKYVDDEETRERFRREARAAAMLHHPNVVSIIDYGEARADNVPAYIVMELVSGESLRTILQRENRFIPERAIRLMTEICAGVGAAHRHNVVHRDLKPDNIIVLPPDEDTGRERAKVVDFGIAKLRDLAAGDHTITQVGAVVGTPFYMSPEQCRGESLDARADIYSLGAMLYEMLAGRPPFTAPTFTGIIAKHLTEAPPPLIPERAQIPPGLEAVILRALAKDPAARQPDAVALGRELRDAFGLSSERVFDTPETTREHVTQPRHTQTAPPVEAPHITPEPSPTVTAGGTSRRATGWILGIAFLLVCIVAAVVGFSVLILSANRSGATKNASSNLRAGSNQAVSQTLTVNNGPGAIFNQPAAAAASGNTVEQKVVGGVMLRDSDVAGLNQQQRSFLRNTVYARHGRVFARPDLQKYFSNKPWYTPNPAYQDSDLTQVDRANISLLASETEVNTQAQAFSSAQTEIVATLNGWAAATRAHDLAAHMNYFADVLDFYYRRTNVTRDEVRADLARAYEKFSVLNVAIGNFNVTLDNSGTRAAATFDKTWNFSGISQTSGAVRQLAWLSKDAYGNWRITGIKDVQNLSHP